MFARHAGNQLKKWLGVTHDEVTYSNDYTIVEVPGKVVYRSEEDDAHNIMVLRSSTPIKVSRRCMVVVNPDLGKFGMYNSQYICEPGDIPTVYLHNPNTFFEDMGLEWLFKIYFLK